MLFYGIPLSDLLDAYEVCVTLACVYLVFYAEISLNARWQIKRKKEGERKSERKRKGIRERRREGGRERTEN